MLTWFGCYSESYRPVRRVVKPKRCLAPNDTCSRCAGSAEHRWTRRESKSEGSACTHGKKGPPCWNLHRGIAKQCTDRERPGMQSAPLLRVKAPPRAATTHTPARAPAHSRFNAGSNVIVLVPANAAIDTQLHQVVALAQSSRSLEREGAPSARRAAAYPALEHTGSLHAPNSVENA